MNKWEHRDKKVSNRQKLSKNKTYGEFMKRNKQREQRVDKETRAGLVSDARRLDWLDSIDEND